jgi:hypothetical protein
MPSKLSKFRTPLKSFTSRVVLRDAKLPAERVEWMEFGRRVTLSETSNPNFSSSSHAEQNFDPDLFFEFAKYGLGQ